MKYRTKEDLGASFRSFFHLHFMAVEKPRVILNWSCDEPKEKTGILSLDQISKNNLKPVGNCFEASLSGGVPVYAGKRYSLNSLPPGVLR